MSLIVLVTEEISPYFTAPSPTNILTIDKPIRKNQGLAGRADFGSIVTW
ncbi:MULTISPECIES: hypothetical protein [unclassified Agarivorans]|nr:MULTISPECIES: hypothetical protein [unclassified Agarivorans]MDO6686997.1 hypothetical protein [Agarivorans sp. 3_MG-2023]MDO6713591.1 hypothetical protein [Agarivorans sp. 2_MG-2023]